MCGSHRNRQLGVAGVVDRQIHSGRNRTAKCALRPAIAGISGGNRHHHTGFDDPIDLDAERTLTASKPFRLKVVSNTHVYTVNPNAPAVAIDLLDLLDGSDQIARLAFAVVTLFNQTETLGLYRHARYDAYPNSYKSRFMY